MTSLDSYSHLNKVNQGASDLLIFIAGFISKIKPTKAMHVANWELTVCYKHARLENNDSLDMQLKQ